MTLDNRSPKNANVAALDRHRAWKLKAQRILHQLLAEVEAKDFKGSVALEIHAAGGYIGSVKHKRDCTVDIE